MSRQQRKSYGTWDFRRYPFIDTSPLPEITVPAYVRHALSSGGGEPGSTSAKTRAKVLGSRLSTADWPPKLFHCRTTGKSYIFWDNYLLHAAGLSPGPSVKDALAVYVSPYDDRTFHFRDNCKLHNRVKRLEEASEMELFKRVAPDSSEDRLEKAVKKKRVEFRFWDRPDDEDIVQHELDNLRRDRLMDAKKGGAEADTEVRSRESVSDEKQEAIPRFEPDLMSRPTLKWPRNYDDLPPVRQPRAAASGPSHRGWTHSDDADSWYLESHTRGIHDEYNEFTRDLFGERAVCPRLWSTVFPETERHISQRSHV